MSQKSPRSYEILIRTTPEHLWNALTNGDLTPHYYYNARVESTWKQGAPYLYRNPEGGVDIEGTVLEVDPPRRLVTTFKTIWDPEGANSSPSRITWEIEPMGPVCKLTAIHEDIEPEAFEAMGLNDGWVLIISGLKTFLETGEPLGIG